MPSSENSTFERIQKEISEEVEREKELKRLQQQLHSLNNNNTKENNAHNEDYSEKNGKILKDDFSPGLLKKSLSVSVLMNGDHKDSNEDSIKLNSVIISDFARVNGNTKINGICSNESVVVNGNSKVNEGTTINGNQKPNSTQHELNGNATRQTSSYKTYNRSKSEALQVNGKSQISRIFATNPQTKGLMHRFLKSRGKVNIHSSKNVTPNIPQSSSRSWNIPDFTETTKSTYDPSKCVRKGFIPVEEKIRKEFQDMHVRELELKKTRRSSHVEYNSLTDESEESSLENPLRVTKSMAQLYDPDDYESESTSGSNSLKPARSLAELCDIDDEEELISSSALITKFEMLIRKNQEVRT